jgi:hypothetical protein
MADPWLPGYDVGARFCRETEEGAPSLRRVALNPRTSIEATYEAALSIAAERIEELEEIISDLVNNENERSVMGTYPGRAEVFRKAWDRAAEAVGLDDGADA